jgi:hypothetical protein
LLATPIAGPLIRSTGAFPADEAPTAKLGDELGRA